MYQIVVKDINIFNSKTCKYVASDTLLQPDDGMIVGSLV
jgi:hypothetical protein